jgi:alkylhydroperoxidase family enzyme
LNTRVPDVPADRYAGLRALLEQSVRSGEASAPAADRELAFARPEELAGARGLYCAQVALDANGVTDADVAALRTEGLGDVEIFELTAAAAVGQGSRQLTAALAALAASREPRPS